MSLVFRCGSTFSRDSSSQILPPAHAFLVGVCCVIADTCLGALQSIGTDLEQSLNGTFVQTLAFGRAGEAWVAGQDGLGIYTDSNLSSHGPSSSGKMPLPAGIVALVPTTSDSATAITLNGEVFYISKRGAIESVKPATGRLIARPSVHEDGTIYRVTKDGIYKDRLSFTSTDGSESDPKPILGHFTSNAIEHPIAGLCAASDHKILCRLDQRDFSALEVFKGTGNHKIVGLAEIGESGEMAYWTESGIVSVADLEFTPSSTWSLQLPFSAGGIKAVAPYDEHLLVGGDAGLFSIDLVSRKGATIDLGRNARVTNLVEGPHGIWVTHDAGVSLVRATNTTPWPENYLSSPIEVLALAEKRSAIIIGTYSGIYINDTELGATRRVWPDGHSNLDIDYRTTALQVSEDRLWAGTFSGALYELAFSKHGRLDHSETTLLDSGISALLSVNDNLLIGTAANGLFLLGDTGLSKIELPLPWKVSPSPITSITSSNNNEHIVVTSENEIFLICPKQSWSECGHSSAPSNPSRPVFLASAIDQNYDVLIGTLHGGVYRSSVNQIRRGVSPTPFAIAHLDGQPVFTLDYDHKNTFWAGTDSGVVSFQRDPLNVRAFTTLHGLVNKDSNHGASLISEAGQVYIGGKSGYSALNPSDHTEVSTAPIIRVSSIRAGAFVDDASSLEDWKIPDGIELPHLNNGVLLAVSLNDFRDVSSNTFEFTLEGWENSPRRLLGDGEASYGFLPPGSYTFRARGADPLGVWSENEIVIPITVFPPPWKTWWAYLIYATAAIALVLLYARYQEQRVRTRIRMEQAADDQAALARLEDDWQEQTEVTERLLNAVSPSALRLLDTVGAAIEAERIGAGSHGQRFDALQSRVNALRVQERLTKHTVLADTTNLHALVTELVASICEGSSTAGARIFLNDAPDKDISALDARYLALVVHETLDFVMNRVCESAGAQSIVQMEIETPAQRSVATDAYRIVIEDRDQKGPPDPELEQALPVTMHFVELFGGAFEHDPDLGLHLELELPLGSG